MIGSELNTTSFHLNSFSLERPKEGNEFTLIGTVHRMGNSDVIRNYHWEDNVYDNRYYYRLSQMILMERKRY